MKKFLAVLMCLLLFVSLFAGCKKNEASSSESETASTEFSTDDVIFAEDGESRYQIIKPSSSSKEIGAAAATVFRQIRKVFAVGAKNVYDYVDGTDMYEILIGETNRPESQIAKEYLYSELSGRVNDYVICTIGKKIVIIGANDDATVAAVNYFNENFVVEGGVSGGILYTYKTEGDFIDITIAGTNILKYNIIRPHYNSSYVTQIEIDELEEYILKNTGFKKTALEDMYEDEGEYEIVIGNTNREGGLEINDYDTYAIKTVGNKVFINGGSNHATAMAVSEFNKMLESGNVTDVEGNYYTTLASYDKSKYFTPTWYDNFDGNTVDTTKWNHYGPGQSDSKGRNGKTAIRSKDPNLCYVSGGKFVITAHQDQNYYYGGMLRSDGLMDFRYGIAEISCIMPDGDGFWIAFWACSNEGGRILSPEIDITEMFGDAARTAANCHTWPTEDTEHTIGKVEHYSLDGKYSNEKKRLMLDNPKDDPHFGLNFHTFGMLWDKTQMTFTCDGEIYFSYDITKDNYDKETFNHSLYLIVSMAVGFENGGLDINGATEYEWQNTNKFITDSVYVYQLYDGVHELNGKIVK